MAPPRRSVGPTCSFFSRPVLESQLRKPRSYIEAFRERGRPRNPKDSGAGAEDRLSEAKQGRETFYTFLWTLQKPNAISRVFWATRKRIFRKKNLRVGETRRWLQIAGPISARGENAAAEELKSARQ